jgi:hypothetical protein
MKSRAVVSRIPANSPSDQRDRAGKYAGPGRVYTVSRAQVPLIRYSVADPTGPRAGRGCMNVSDANAPFQEPSAANTT